MIVNALITEYNPFHNGHIYHINEAQRINPADVTIALMSGNFTQRGEIAITDKFTRAEAVIPHVDLVVELPLYTAISAADGFGSGAIHLAHRLKATHVIFGSESGSIAELEKIIAELGDADTQRRIKEELSLGKSYPRALSEALGESRGLSPNNILGISYMKAINEQHAPITPLTITRTGNHFTDKALSQQAYSSATSIRHAILSNNRSEAARFMPRQMLSKIERPLSNEAMFNTLKIMILNATPHQLSSIYMMDEGLEHRLKSLIRSATSYESFIERVKTKRYTRTRLNRLMLSILLNVTTEDMKHTHDTNAVRVLAMNATGQAYLRTLKDDLTVVTNVTKAHAARFTNEIKATDVYNTLSGGVRDDFNTPVIMDSETSY